MMRCVGGRRRQSRSSSATTPTSCASPTTWRIRRTSQPAPGRLCVTRWGGLPPLRRRPLPSRAHRITDSVEARPAWPSAGRPSTASGSRRASPDLGVRRPGFPSTCPPTENGVMADSTHRRCRSPVPQQQGKVARPTPPDPLHLVVGVPRRRVLGGRIRPRARARGRRVRSSSSRAKDVVVRGWYDDNRAARRRRPGALDARGVLRRPRTAYHRVRRTDGQSSPVEPVVADGAAPSGDSTSRTLLPAFLRREEARAHVHLPVRAVLRVVPLLPDEGAASCSSKARTDGPPLPGRARQHRGVVRPATTEWIRFIEADEPLPHRRPHAPPAPRAPPYVREEIPFCAVSRSVADPSLTSF